MRALRLVPCLLLPFMLPPTARTAELFPVNCDIVLFEAEADRADRVLEGELAATRLAAAQDIFGMVEGLWKAGAVPKIIYLRREYNRDIAALEVQRQEILLSQQDALLELYRGYCGDSEGKSGSPLKLYKSRDCEARGVASEIAEVELAFREALLAGYRELEEEDVASRSQVILQERDVELARETRDDLRLRWEDCREEPAPGGDRPTGGGSP